jgi:hypothetical protein
LSIIRFGSITGSNWPEVEAEVGIRVEGLMTLARKITPYLPELSKTRILTFSEEQKVMSQSDIYRSMRFISLGSNRHTVDMCRNALPRHMKVPEQISFRDPVVQIPIIGDILCKCFKEAPVMILKDAVFEALVQVGSLDEQERDRFLANFQMDPLREEIKYNLGSDCIRFFFEEKMGAAKVFRFEFVRSRSQYR